MQVWIVGSVFTVVVALLGVFMRIAFNNLNDSVKTLSRGTEEIKGIVNQVRVDIAEKYVTKSDMFRCQDENKTAHKELWQEMKE